MEKENFNNTEFKRELGLRDKQPYDYERYKAVNSGLTKDMYKYLRGNKNEWKILCGVGVKIRWSNEVLEPLEVLTDDDSRNVCMLHLYRYSPDFYLGFSIW